MFLVAHEVAPAAMPRSDSELVDQSGGGPAEATAEASHIAVARVITNVTYAARMARPELLRTVVYLARCLTKWSADMDKRLHRILAYIHDSLVYRKYVCNDDTIIGVCSRAQIMLDVLKRNALRLVQRLPVLGRARSYHCPSCLRGRGMSPDLPQKPRL